MGKGIRVGVRVRVGVGVRVWYRVRDMVWVTVIFPLHGNTLKAQP